MWTNDKAKLRTHRRMARAAIRVALRYGASTEEILSEYNAVRKMEKSIGSSYFTHNYGLTNNE